MMMMMILMMTVTMMLMVLVIVMMMMSMMPVMTTTGLPVMMLPLVTMTTTKFHLNKKDTLQLTVDCNEAPASIRTLDNCINKATNGALCRIFDACDRSSLEHITGAR